MDYVRGFISFIGGIFLAIGIVTLCEPILPKDGVAPLFIGLVIFIGSIGLVFLIVDGLFGNDDKIPPTKQSPNDIPDDEIEVVISKPTTKTAKARKRENENNLNKINETKEHKRVGYNVSIDSYEDGYPKILVPEHLCIVRTHKFIRDKKKIKRRGYTEEKFQNLLREELPTKVKIYGNLSIATSNKTFPYEPDIALIVKSWRNIRIDIEIDEPYNGYTRELTHVGKNDTRRDDYFNRRGWVVLRFTEKQIHKFPQTCIDLIKEILANLDNYNFKYTDYDIVDLKKSIFEEIWNGAKASEWEINKYRESYLNHEFGIANSDPIKQLQNLTIQEHSEESLVDKESDAKIVVSHGFEVEEIDFSFLDTMEEIDFLEDDIVTDPHEPILESDIATTVDSDTVIVTMEPPDLTLLLDTTDDIFSDLNDPLLESDPATPVDTTLIINTPEKSLDSNNYKLEYLISIAIEKGCAVQMTYTNYSLISSDRKVSDLAYTKEFIIDGYEYKEHFSGYCSLRKEERSFKISRIDYLKILDANT
ncbi:hypothetical protein [uncultured Nonlabens sp.]|uniref:hypothetical protein n=1 Tax=uncultured Nonlabens sp. TaxID=859306 RepID=UPI0026250192|nr:hypothetical protein [uncultured Nonlabens sp.]